MQKQTNQKKANNSFPTDLSKWRFMIVNKPTIHRGHNAIYCSDITLSANRWGSQAFAMLSYLSYIVYIVLLSTKKLEVKSAKNDRYKI